GAGSSATSPCPSWYATILSNADSAMSCSPAIRALTNVTEFGVGEILTASFSRANSPLSWATHNGRFAPPGNVMTLSGTGACAGALYDNARQHAASNAQVSRLRMDIPPM